MTVVMCDTCGDGVDLTSEVVCLPFDCKRCKDDRTQTTPVPSNIIKTKPLTLPKKSETAFGTLASGNPKNAQGSAVKNLVSPEQFLNRVFNDQPCDTTVEATTELIADLESQLAAEKQSANIAQQYIGNLEYSLDNLCYDVQEKNEYVEKLWAGLDTMREMRDKARLDASTLGVDLMRARQEIVDRDNVIGDLRFELKNSHEETAYAELDIKYFRELRNHFRDLAVERFDHPFRNLWTWFTRLF